MEQRKNTMALWLPLMWCLHHINCRDLMWTKPDSHLWQIMYSCRSETRLNTRKCSSSLTNIMSRIWLCLALISTLWNFSNLLDNNSRRLKLRFLTLSDRTKFSKCMANNWPQKCFLSIQKETWSFIWKSTRNFKHQTRWAKETLKLKMLNSKAKSIMTSKFTTLWQLQLAKKVEKQYWKAIALSFSLQNTKETQ